MVSPARQRGAALKGFFEMSNVSGASVNIDPEKENFDEGAPPPWT
jgi:hypothetical protein